MTLDNTLRHLLPKETLRHLPKEDLKAHKLSVKEEIRAKLEDRTVRQILKAIGARVGDVAAYGTYESCITMGDLDYAELIPILLYVTEIDSYDVRQLYDTPTKSPVWKAFTQLSKEAVEKEESSRLGMVFRCKNIDQKMYIMHNYQELSVDTQVCLSFLVRGERYFVHLWKEALDAIGKRWPKQ